MAKRRHKKYRVHHIGGKVSAERKANTMRHKGQRVRVLLIDRKPKTYAVFSDGVRRHKAKAKYVKHRKHKRKGKGVFGFRF